MTIPTKPIFPGEIISRYHQKLPIGKTSGYDLITTKVLKKHL